MKHRLIRTLWRWLVPSLGILGFMSLCFVLGAAVMFFKLAPGNFLERAFDGGQAWFEKKSAHSDEHQLEWNGGLALAVDKPDKTFDGFTLYTTTAGSAAFLVDMHGKVVHQWAVPFRQVWPERNPPHVTKPVDDSNIFFCGFHLYSNGDLLAVFHGTNDTPYGYGLVKIDKDSRVIWRYSRNVHHELDVAQDGKIYVLTQSFTWTRPTGLNIGGREPYLLDHLVVLSPEGSELKDIPILDALQNSPYAPLLGPIGKVAWNRRGKQLAQIGDVLHTNYVKVLRGDLAPKFPMFKEGQLLISIRELSTLAVLDPETGSVVWAAQGPWRKQHSPEFLGNGRLLIFDNWGPARGSRLLEYDPQTQALPWSYSDQLGPDFDCDERGVCQRLPNGNTLIVDSENGKIREVSESKETVWLCSSRAHIPSGRRYSPKELSFLSPAERPRP